MSFILDALKKSEAERQRQNAPGFSDVADGANRRSAPRWLWLVGALLAVNLLVLAVVLLRPDPTPVLSNPAVVDVPGINDFANDADIDTQDPPASFSDRVAEAKKMRPAESPAAVEHEQAVVTVASVPQHRPPTTLTQAYPTFSEVRVNGTVELPDLHLDIHVYGEQAVDRFVFVNMSKYREHTALAEGPVVKEIVPEGVILDYQGTQFLLPRQ